MKTKSAKPSITVRLEPQVNNMLRKASDATGADITELVQRTLEKSLPVIVHDLMHERQRAARSFFAGQRSERKAA